MRAKSLLLILVALVMAGGTALAIRGWLDAQRAQMQAPAPVAQAPAPRGTEILVAKVDIAAGQFIRPEHLRWSPGPTARCRRTTSSRAVVRWRISSARWRACRSRQASR